MSRSSLFIHVEALFESVNTSAGIYEFLSTGEEWMTLGTNFNADVLFGRAGLNDLTASTFNCCRLVIRMDSFFHLSHLFHYSR